MQGSNRGGSGTSATVTKALEKRARNIILITDAQVTDFGRILQLVDRESQEDNKRRINVISIDSAPNTMLVREIAGAVVGLGIRNYEPRDPFSGWLGPQRSVVTFR